MKKFKFTQGPWRVLPEECDKTYIRIRGTRLGERYKVANIITPVHEGVLPLEAEETRANARLIKASPDMFILLYKLAIGMETIEIEEVKKLLLQINGVNE